jgi:hypothetical protein
MDRRGGNTWTASAVVKAFSGCNMMCNSVDLHRMRMAEQVAQNDSWPIKQQAAASTCSSNALVQQRWESTCCALQMCPLRPNRPCMLLHLACHNLLLILLRSIFPRI